MYSQKSKISLNLFVVSSVRVNISKVINPNILKNNIEKFKDSLRDILNCSYNFGKVDLSLQYLLSLGSDLFP